MQLDIFNLVRFESCQTEQVFFCYETRFCKFEFAYICMFYYLYILNGKLKNVLSVDLLVLDNLHIICCQQYSNDCCIINSKEADLFLTLEVPIMPYGTNCYNKRNI